MDGVLCDFKHLYDLKVKEINYPQAEFDFFRKLKPIHKSIESFLYLYNNFDTYILTSPSYKNPMCYTEKMLWVKDNLGEKIVENLIISCHKNLLIGDYLIDDNLQGCGQENFKGELIHFGSHKFPSWEEICLFFKNKITE